jgi:hypothetical protein
VYHLGAELGEAWCGLRRAGWSGTRARVSDGVWRRGQSARESKAVQNEVRASVGQGRGSKKGAGRGGGRRGREIRRGARGRTRRSTAGAGRAELTGQAHGVEREKGTCGATTQQLANWARETEREEGSAGEETGTDRSAPLGSEREREGARERELPLIGGVRLSGGAGAWLGWAELG